LKTVVVRLTKEEVLTLLEVLQETLEKKPEEKIERILQNLKLSMTVDEAELIYKVVGEHLQRIESKIDKLHASLTPMSNPTLTEQARKTLMAVNKLGKADASKVAELTGRTRSAESRYLNDLTRLGLLKKQKEGRTAYFTAVQPV